MLNLIDIVTAAQAKILDLIVVVVNLGNKKKLDNIDIISLFEIQANVWSPQHCQLCADGSQALVAREHWIQLIKITNEK